MDYKKLSIALAVLVIILVVAFVFDIKTFTGGESDSEDSDLTPGGEESIDDIFAEPPADFEPPVLPP